MPYVTLKTSNFLVMDFLAWPEGESERRWISGPVSRAYVGRLRARYDAIIGLALALFLPTILN